MIVLLLDPLELTTVLVVQLVLLAEQAPERGQGVDERHHRPGGDSPGDADAQGCARAVEPGEPSGQPVAAAMIPPMRTPAPARALCWSRLMQHATTNDRP